ncbi:MAG: TldD/PmbA family protein [Chloroflexi bacterium]|nr:TldD/PmbA family protein [Chloroflexota bacterium]
MPLNSDPRELLAMALRGLAADYVEVRIEESESTRLSFRGPELEDIGHTTERGGNVRALVNGGWGFASFNSLKELREKAEWAVQAARLTGKGKTQIAESPTIVDTVPVSLGKEPRQVPITEKRRLFSEYNQIMLGASSQIQTTRVAYADSYRHVWFANSSGSLIEQERAQMQAALLAIARDGTNVQQAHFGLGSVVDYRDLEGLHDRAREVAERAVALLSAPPVNGGEYTVVLDPKLAGIFAHEAFGHLSEADHVYENERLKEIMVLGRRFGGEHLNILDGAAQPGLRGSYKYDDEGTPAQTTSLIQNGVLVGRLHSLETAGIMEEQTTGNARALNYRFHPIVRMTNTWIAPGEIPFSEMLADIKEGVYCKDSFGGETSMEMFTFSAAEAYMIRNGRLAEPLRGVLLSGNVFNTLENIDAIGDDFAWLNSGGCGKAGQSPLPVATGSPHIRIRRCVVGGR